MRIGVVTTSYPRSPGEPAGGFVSELNDCLIDHGHEVQVLAAGGAEVDDRWHRAEVVRIPSALFYEGGAPDALGSATSFAAAGLFSVRLLAAIRQHSRHWDAVVAHWLAPCALASSLAAPKLPLWAIGHGSDVHVLAKSRLTGVAARLLDRPSVHLGFVSQELRDRFASRGVRAQRVAERARVCSMGIELEHFRSLPRVREAVPVVAFLGRLVHLKGVDVLLQAVAGLDFECQLVVAGTGPESSRLHRLASELSQEVTWLGEVRGVERDQLLARADIVVLPSRMSHGRNEGMPVVALEALAAGPEIIVSNNGGLGAIPTSVCHHVQPEDPMALQASLAKILAGCETKNPNAWLEQFDWSVIAPRLLPGLIGAHS